MNADRGIRMIASTTIPWTGAGSRRVKTLFEAQSSVRLTLEEWAPATRVERVLPEGWEELLVFDGESEEATWGDPRYVLLGPEDGEVLHAGESGCHLVRLSYGRRLPDTTWTQGGFSPDDKARSGVRSYREFLWNRVPARQPNDPGSRTAELSRSPSGRFVTTLLEAQAGWSLPEHDHPLDVASYCLRGDGVLAAGGTEYPRVVHQVALIPSGARHSFLAGADGTVLLIFVFPAGSLQ